MSIGAISTGSLSQYVLTSSNLTQSQQTWQTLQQSLASGNLTAAQTAFNTYQQQNKNLTNISGTSSSSGSQLATDMTALGAALSSGDLSGAQQAFATVQTDMKSTPSQAMANANTAMAQAQQWVNDLLDIPNSSSSSSSDPTASLLQNALSLDESSTSTDPATEALQSETGAAGTAGSPSLDVYA